MRERWFEKLKRKKEMEALLDKAIIKVGNSLVRENNALKEMRENGEIVDDQVTVVKDLQETWIGLMVHKHELKTCKDIDISKILNTGMICVTAIGMNLYLINKEEDEGKLINKRAPRIDLPRLF